ncbi:hypothetical protein EXU57_08845 [Segetibacter sp. 3557_3]|uniref:hypothetical protein n=1 Tax=Segetibacter sp. 3557_3 TaxID=2547429 RepID=UPI0010591A7B|nr:hypothetical protein [Segetibacter sp. 3557_3]TDH26903.1 hypothetical protein EXU57_08845 [Segetibacter sp. 3557_3]
MKKDSNYISYFTALLVVVLVGVKYGGQTLIRWLPFVTILLSPLVGAFTIKNYNIDKSTVDSSVKVFRKKIVWLGTLFLLSILLLLLLSELRLLAFAMLGALGMSLLGLVVYKPR